MFEEMKWQKELRGQPLFVLGQLALPKPAGILKTYRPPHLLGRPSTDIEFSGLVGRFTQRRARHHGHIPAQRPPDLHRHGDCLPRRLPDVLLPGPRHPPRLLFRPRTLTGHQLGRAVLNLTFFFFFVVLSRLQGRDAAERDPVVDPQRPFRPGDLAT